MKLPLALLGLICCSCAIAQGLTQYDALLKRSETDEVVIASKEKLTLNSALLQVEVSDRHSYRAQGKEDYYMNLYRVVGPNAALISPLYAGLKFSDLLVDFKEFAPENVLRASDGTEAIIYIAGFSGDSGTSLRCMIPTSNSNVFLHLSANSIAFMDGTDFEDFKSEFRRVALKFINQTQRELRNQSVDKSDTTAPK